MKKILVIFIVLVSQLLVAQSTYSGYKFKFLNSLKQIEIKDTQNEYYRDAIEAVEQGQTPYLND